MEAADARRLTDLESNLAQIGGPMAKGLVRKGYREISAGREALSPPEWETLVETVSVQIERVWGRRLPNGTRAMLRHLCGLTSTRNHA